MLQAKFRKRNKEETAESYFLAGRSLVWWMVGGSLFASNIGGSQFIGVSGDAAATGIAVVSYEWQVLYVVRCGGTRWDIMSYDTDGTVVLLKYVSHSLRADPSFPKGRRVCATSTESLLRLFS